VVHHGCSALLAEHRDTAMLARQLATIAEDADVEARCIAC
jgi:hypothetical protein